MVFYDAPRLGRSFNLLTHKFTENMMWSASKAAIRKFWTREFGKPPKDFDCPFGRQVTNALPTIVSCSNHIFPRPEDWPEGVHNTGPWFLDEGAGWQPPADLIDFLQAGPPPVYVGFGSTGDPSQASRISTLVVDALQRAGQRGVLATGWSGMAKLESVLDGIFILESIPHSWLFPKMAAVVHHGGAGTTAAGLRAGVPSVIIPNSNDHFAWARRVHELGVGPKPIRGKDLSAEGLAQAIRSALTVEIKEAAKKIGVLLRRENGAATAAKIILNCVD
jgi:sterol 3beta-glucosyltransferase